MEGVGAFGAGRGGTSAPAGIVVAGCGSAREGACRDQLGPASARIARAVAAGRPVLWVEAYSSACARSAARARGSAVPDVSAALEELWARGVRDATVVPTHLVDGRGYRAVRRAAEHAAPLFDSVRLGPPLLSSASDVAAVASAACDRFPRAPGERTVLVGHGSPGSGQLAYLALGYELARRGRDDMAIGLLKGGPAPDEVAVRLASERPRPRAVRLVPLMFACGAHFDRDVASDREGSWAARMRAAGFEVRICEEGLCSDPAVLRLAAEHAASAPGVGPSHAPASRPASAGPSPRFPLFVDLAGAPCLVVGAGAVGARRARALEAFGAAVTVVDPAAPAGALGGARVVARPYEPGDEEGCFVAVAATDDREVNRTVGERCRRWGIPVSVADAPAECTFFFPALCEGAGLVAGVASHGADHASVARAAARIRGVLDGFGGDAR